MCFRIRRTVMLAAAVLMIITACNPGPQDIRIGQQECDHCRMIISQEQFAAQLVTSEGRQYAFDAIECMAAFVNSSNAEEMDIHSLWVPDFLAPGRWLPAGGAWYLQSEKLRSPMALNFSAYASEQAVREQQASFGGPVLNWEEVQSIVRQRWSGGHHH